MSLPVRVVAARDVLRVLGPAKSQISRFATASRSITCRKTYPCLSSNSRRNFSITHPQFENTPAGTVGSGASAASPSTTSNLQTPTTAEAVSPLIPNDYMSSAERSIWDKLQTSLSPTRLEVQDISGGCGSMYGIEIESEKFRGVGTLKQQRMVNEILKEEIKGWHGVQLRTKAP